ncbi:hypothetical protein V2J09_020155 [Rumex salicifolius]
MELDDEGQTGIDRDGGSFDAMMEDSDPKTSGEVVCSRLQGGDTEMGQGYDQDNINIITWNVQGAGSREFMITLKELIRIHNPAILVMVETRLSGRQADKVRDTIGFDGVARAEAIGFQGGIWVLWRKAMVNLK